MSKILLLYVAAFVVVLAVGVVVLVIKRLGILNDSGSSDTSSKAAFSARYKVRDYIQSPAERTLMAALLEAIRAANQSQHLVIFPSVRLAEVLGVDSNHHRDPSSKQSATNRIVSKQFDFVICDAKSTRPLLVVELDDKSHSRKDRASRDEFVDHACRTAGLPILHVTAASKYDTSQLMAQMMDALV